MDPIIAGLLANVASMALSGVAASAVSVLKTPQPNGPKIDLVQDPDQEIDITVVPEIREALQSEAVNTFLESHIFAQLSARTDSEANSVERFEQQLAETFCVYLEDKANIQEEVSRSLWRALTDHLDQVSGVHDLRIELAERERRELASMDGSQPMPRSAPDTTPTFIVEAAGRLRNIQALEAAFSLGNAIRELSCQSAAQMRLDHATESPIQANSIPFDSLYVSRSVQLARLPGQHSAASEESVTGERLLDSDSRRVVIKGNPGAGKSTMLQHLVRTIAQSPDRRVPLVARVREFGGDRLMLIEEIVAALKHDLQLHDVSTDDVHTLLVLGRAVVLFDGLDEALDGARKRSIASAIDSFATRFPLVRIIVTSRSVGYELAPLGPMFQSATLLDLTEDQVRDYIDKWFALMGSAPDADALFHELATIPDLSRNPLMLSLICTLYRARGHVPRNRRQVYAECADLLFNRWDPMRRIEQPVDQVQHGQDLMQDIAIWFYRSKSAQRGVEEAQLSGIVEHFFRDTAGALPTDAKRRARSFVEYCADRAWLLTSVGKNEHNQRLYSFTHRTFMEYFSAEHLARGESGVPDLCRVIVEAYGANSSSVVPELVIQAVEAARRGQGRQIIARLREMERGVSRRWQYLALRIRLSSALTLPGEQIDLILKEVFLGLVERPDMTRSLIRSILGLPRNNRRRLFAHILQDPEIGEPVLTGAERVQWAQTLMGAWSGEVLSGGSGGEDPDEWRQNMEKIWHAVAGDSEFIPDPTTRTYAWQLGWPLVENLVPEDLRPSWPAGHSEAVSSRLSYALADVFDPRVSVAVRERALSVLSQLPNVVEREFWSFGDATNLATYMSDLVSGGGLGELQIPVSARRGLMVVSLAAIEADDENFATEIPSVSALIGVDLEAAALGRLPGRGRNERVEAAMSKADDECVPLWYRRWLRNRFSLVLPPGAEWEEGDAIK